MEGLDVTLLGHTQACEPLIKSILHKPHRRSIEVRHDPRSLYLKVTGSVVKVEGHHTGDTTE